MQPVLLLNTLQVAHHNNNIKIAHAAKPTLMRPVCWSTLTQSSLSSCCSQDCAEQNGMQAASASQCTVSGCVQAYPTSCPAATVSGSTGAAYYASSTSSDAYTTAQGSIALDPTSVTDACKAVSFFQCVESYSVDVDGSTFTLTSTSGTASECGTGSGKHFLCHNQVSSHVEHMMHRQAVKY